MCYRLGAEVVNMRAGVLVAVLVAGCQHKAALDAKDREIGELKAKLAVAEGEAAGYKVQLAAVQNGKVQPAAGAPSAATERAIAPPVDPSTFTHDLKGQLDRIQAEGNARAMADVDAGRVKTGAPRILDKSGMVDDLIRDEDVLAMIAAAKEPENREVTYEQVEKAPERFAGTPVVVTGKILDIAESGGVTLAQLYEPHGYGGRPYVVAVRSATDFVRRNDVEAVGYFAGAAEWTATVWRTRDVPSIAAIALMKPGTLKKLQATYRAGGARKGGKGQ
jgi:hypothetical protein